MMWIVVGTDQPARLVHCNRDFRLRRRAHGFSADCYLVDARSDLLPEGSGGAVHPNLTAGDQSLRRTTRAHPRVSDEFLQTDGRGAGHGSLTLGVNSPAAASLSISACDRNASGQ